MATHPEPQSSLSEVDSLEVLQTDLQKDLYSYKECREIGKSFLDELKESIKADFMPDIEEPSVKATKYLEETEILQLLEASLYSVLCELYLALYRSIVYF